MQPTREAELSTGGDFAFDVELGSRIFSDKDGSESGTNALGVEPRDFGFQFEEDLVADLESIEDACGHAGLTFDWMKRKNSIRGNWGRPPPPVFS